MKSPDLIEVLVKAFAPVITLLASFLSLKLTKWLDAKIKDQELKQVVDKLNVVIPDVVKDIEQSFVSKEKSNSDKLTPEAACQAKNMAVEKVKQQIGERGMGEIKQALNISDSRANSLIASKVEARVFDLRSSISALLGIVLLGLTACHVSPIVTTATIIKTQESVVTAGDETVAKWYLGKHEICLKNGIVVRDSLKKDGTSEEIAKSTGLNTYTKCMENTTQAATKIADIIDIIRSKDKVAANVALSIARGEKPIEALGYATEEVIKLVQDLTKLINEAGVK